MKIIIDENIAYAENAFSEFGEVQLYHGREIKNSILKNADVLICRSITKVNYELLKNTKVKFVGTATIGTDHLDKNYLEKEGIEYANAPGCNSYAVAEYIAAALVNAAVYKNISLQNKSLGIIGYGNIGTKVGTVAEALGMKTIINDPPLESKSNQNKFSSLVEALKCDAVTFHVPLNRTGAHKTFHMLNERNIDHLKKNVILLNTSRGEVIDNIAIEKKINQSMGVFSVFDVWENEPAINMNLMNVVNIATPHVAGYSFEGKVNGTKQIYNAFAKFMHAVPKWKPVLPKLDDPYIYVKNNDSLEQSLGKIFEKVYPQYSDDMLMRKMLKMEYDPRKKYFDELRKNYRLRREFTNFTVKLSNPNSELINVLEKTRFNIDY